MDALAELGVSRETIADFCRRWKVKEFALFGSAARGEMRPDSDVDVMVEFEPDGLPHGWGYIDMILELEDLFGRSVDMLTKGIIRNPFRHRSIERDLIVLYAA